MLVVGRASASSACEYLLLILRGLQWDLQELRGNLGMNFLVDTKQTEPRIRGATCIVFVLFVWPCSDICSLDLSSLCLADPRGVIIKLAQNVDSRRLR